MKFPYYDIYNTYEVLSDSNSMSVSNSLSEKISIPLVQVDNGQGVIDLEIKQNFSNFKKSLDILTTTKEELWEARKWLHSKVGRQKAFWVPSWNNDFVPTADIIYSSESSVLIDNINIRGTGTFPLSSIIGLKDGTRIYRDITGANYIDESTESITIDSIFGQDINTSNISLWSIMELYRLDSDNIQISHSNPYTAKISIPLMRIRE